MTIAKDDSVLEIAEISEELPQGMTVAQMNEINNQQSQQTTATKSTPKNRT